MKKEISYAELAMDAMHRAAEEAHKKAAEKNLKIPIWKDGRIIYADPKELLAKKCN